MSRQAIGLTTLGAVLLLVLAWLFLLSPQNDRIAELESQTQAQVDQATVLRGQVAALEQVRAEAPELEAKIARLEAIIPADAALPSALRQLQAAADDAGIRLQVVSPVRPTPVGDETQPGLHQMSLGLTFSGSYFQTVDFLRRIEDPAITARAFLVDSVTLAPAEYPTLDVSIQARMFALLDEAPLTSAEQEAATPPAPTDAATEATS